MIIMALLLSSLQAEPFVARTNWRTFGAVNSSCGEWLMRKDDQTHRLGQLAWVAGFLSGINLAAGGEITDVDTASLVAEIDRRCTAEPLLKVGNIIIEFYYRLRRR